jgi:peptide/nickel transport system permease protein
MLQYIVRRIFLSIPVLLGILLVTFTIARLVPGDPCRAILGEKATQATCDRFIREKGLDKPIPVQFGIYLGEILRGDFGTSVRYNMPVTRMLAERLPMTIELSISALFLSMLAGIPLGIISAIRHNSWVDVTTMVWANIGVSMPVFWLGLMLAFVFPAPEGYPFLVAAFGRVSQGFKRSILRGLGLTPEEGFGMVMHFLSRLNILNAI